MTMLNFLLDALPWVALSGALGYLIGHFACAGRCERWAAQAEQQAEDLARRDLEIDRLSASLAVSRERNAEFARHTDRLAAQNLALQAPWATEARRQPAAQR